MDTKVVPVETPLLKSAPMFEVRCATKAGICRLEGSREFLLEVAGMIFKELEQPPALLRGRVAYEAFCEFRARLDPDWEPKPWEELTNELRADWAAVELSLTGAPE